MQRIQRQMVPKSGGQNGWHAWHAGSNAYLAEQLGVVGAIPIFLGGVYHETPLDRKSFWEEQRDQGTVNHVLDSVGDIYANMLGMTIGYLDPTGNAIQHAIQAGDYIPGPTDPWMGGGARYTGDPTDAWGPYRR